MLVGSNLRPSAVDLAVTPKPCSRWLVVAKLRPRLCDMISTYQWVIVHFQDYNTLMLRAIFTPSTNMCFDNIPAIQKWHLSIGFHPHLISSMRSDYVECCNVKSEFACFREPRPKQLASFHINIGSVDTHTFRDTFRQTVDSAVRCWSLDWLDGANSSTLEIGACEIPCGSLL